tara:strand:- start:1187 stop:1303 length:117 start_codon:yes stop_codon:yes gene_type:complete
MKVKDLKEAIKDMDDEQELTIRTVQSFVIEPVRSDQDE